MTLVPVEKLPEKHTRHDITACNNKSVQTYLKEFMKMNVKYARVDFTNMDYSDLSIGYRTFRDSVYRSALPINVVQRSGHVYLIRKDLEDPNEQL